MSTTDSNDDIVVTAISVVIITVVSLIIALFLFDEQTTRKQTTKKHTNFAAAPKKTKQNMVANGPAASPNMGDVMRNFGTAMQLLTNLSIQSVAELLPEGGNGSQDLILAEHYKNISDVCAQLQVDADQMNPRWNKTYGTGGTEWTGAINDGYKRGGIPYYCPEGWSRFSLNICADSEFNKRFGDWGYAYHGTKGRHVGAILTSGLLGGNGCFCGSGEKAVYMTPSIEYAAHPRYACVEYNPETGCWIQIVLQCRVKPGNIWKKEEETLGATGRGMQIDRNIPNTNMTWLFKPNYTDPDTGFTYVKDAIVCTGIMVRLTKDHPFECDYWWCQNQNYLNQYMQQVDPNQSRIARSHGGWTSHGDVHMRSYTCSGQFLEDSFKLRHTETTILQDVWLANKPFAKGGMRYAYYLSAWNGTENHREQYVLKKYTEETMRHIENGLHISADDAVLKEVATYLAAGLMADEFNKECNLLNWPECNHIHFVEPRVFVIGGKLFFGEKYIDGNFIKWNNNNGEVNHEGVAQGGNMHHMASLFSHFTHKRSNGALQVVDIQGWDLGGKILYTDPQVHTRSYRPSAGGNRHDEMLYKRYSLGNLGYTGMFRFFHSHKCEECAKLGLRHPLEHFIVGVSEIDDKVKKYVKVYEFLALGAVKCVINATFNVTVDYTLSIFHNGSKLNYYQESSLGAIGLNRRNCDEFRFQIN